jgi:hypothetical protein
MKIRLKTLKRILREEAIAPPAAGGGGSGGLGKLLDDLSTQFAAKMRATYPQAEEAIQQEANDLKVQLTAQIKASAAKIKMSAGKPS